MTVAPPTPPCPCSPTQPHPYFRSVPLKYYWIRGEIRGHSGGSKGSGPPLPPPTQPWETHKLHKSGNSGTLKLYNKGKLMLNVCIHVNVLIMIKPDPPPPSSPISFYFLSKMLDLSLLKWGFGIQRISSRSVD